MRPTNFRSGFPSPFRRVFGGFRALSLLAALLAIAAILEWRRVGQNDYSGFAVAIDGDSLRLDGRELRLKGLDAPEYRQTCADAAGAESDCGRQARRALADLLRRGPVSCAERELDRYGRGLVACSIGGEDIGATLVRQGMAVAYGDYEREEEEARSARRGLWAGSFERPGEWRKRHPRGAAESDVAP